MNTEFNNEQESISVEYKIDEKTGKTTCILIDESLAGDAGVSNVLLQLEKYLHPFKAKRNRYKYVGVAECQEMDKYSKQLGKCISYRNARKQLHSDEMQALQDLKQHFKSSINQIDKLIEAKTTAIKNLNHHSSEFINLVYDGCTSDQMKLMDNALERFKAEHPKREE